MRSPVGARRLRRVSKDAPHTPSHSRDTLCPRFAKKTPPQKVEGARDPQERARGRPGARCTRGLMCHDAQAKMHMSIQVQRKHSGLPRAMALRLIRVRPGDRLSCHHHLQRLSLPHDLTPASGRQDHTTSPYASASLVHAHKARDDAAAPTASHATFHDDHDTPLFGARDGRDYTGDLGWGQEFIL